MFLLVISISCYGQQGNNPITDIRFHYSHSMRIPFSSVNIEFHKNLKNKTKIFISSTAKSNDPKWRYSVIDTSYVIDNKIFEEIAAKVKIFEEINLNKAYEIGADGSTCKITFGGNGKEISYCFWIPGVDTEKRGLTDFYNLCKEIILICKLDSKQILE
jgi:hypothetical protein